MKEVQDAKRETEIGCLIVAIALLLSIIIAILI